MADKYWRGGAFTLRGEGDASYDGDGEYDDSGDSYNNSNWMDASGTGVAKPTSSDRAIFSALADKAPSSYDNSAYPHTAGKHWSCCKNLDQTALDVQGILIAPGYDPGSSGGIFGYNAKSLTAGAVTDEGSGEVGIPCDSHGSSAGDYATIGGSGNYDGEHRVTGQVDANKFKIKAPFVAETVEASDTVTFRTPLQISVADTYEIVMMSNGTVYIEASSTTQNIPNLKFSSTSGLLHISSDGNGIWDDILITGGGTLIVADDTKVTKISTTADSTATVIVGENVLGSGTTETNLDCHGGSIVWDSEIGNVFKTGGNITYCQNVPAGTTVDIDRLETYGGNFYWYGKSTMLDYEGWGGNIIALGDEDKIIGSAASAYPQYGGTFDLSQAGGRVSFYAGASVDHQGGTLNPAPRNNVSW